MGLLLAVDRRIVDGTVDLRAGRWDKKTYSAARGLLGSTMASSASARSGSRWPSARGPSGSTSAPWRSPTAARTSSGARRTWDRYGRVASRAAPACDIVSSTCVEPDTVGLVDESFLAL